jgi:hypothetical protein
VDTFLFKVHFQRIAIDAPFPPPVKVTMTHNGPSVRIDSIVDCRQRSSGLSCREF